MDVKCIWRNSFKQYMAYFQFFSYFFRNGWKFLASGGRDPRVVSSANISIYDIRSLW